MRHILCVIAFVVRWISILGFAALCLGTVGLICLAVYEDWRSGRFDSRVIYFIGGGILIAAVILGLVGWAFNFDCKPRARRVIRL